LKNSKKHEAEEENIRKSNVFTEYVFNVIYNILYQKRNILAPNDPHEISDEERRRFLNFKNFSILLYPRNILIYSILLGIIILINIVRTIIDFNLENFSLTMGLIGVEISMVTVAVILQGKLDDYMDNRPPPKEVSDNNQ
jgi:uncharacterized membrane protein YkgB